MKNIIDIKYIFTLVIPLLFFSSCMDDLDRLPWTDENEETVYKDFVGYKQAIAKVYAAYALTGNEGPAGRPDITGLDEGQYADFLRMFFNAQELSTDEAHCIWFGNDQGISGLNELNYSPENPFTRGLYNRCVMQIMYANEFIRNAAKAGERGLNADEIAEVNYFAAEARFIRAFQYWALMDLYGNPPFVDEHSVFGTLPQQIQRADLFAYIEKELLELVNNNLLKDARTNEYGRADKGAAWALLARLYLNAKVYTGTARYTDALTYSSKVIDAGYALKSNYEHLFLANNNLNNNEVILSINYDGVSTKNYGGTTFLINCGSNGDYQNKYSDLLLHYGMRDNATWSGYRARFQFSVKFENGDKRFLFIGETPSISNIGEFTEGLATYKWRNIIINDDNTWDYGSNITYADNDFPLFRLAEMYLIYIEAVKRNGNGSQANALTYMNNLRNRAGIAGYNSFNDFSLEDVLDERARELYWEGHRRTDLIRFDMFTTSKYLWEWKGGVRNGRAVSTHYNIYPIPSADIMANTNLKQNPNY